MEEAGGFAITVLATLCFSRKLSRPAVWLQDSVQALAQGNDLISVTGKPGMHPHGTLEKRLRRLLRVPNANAHHQPAGVDETHLIEQAPGRRKPECNRA